MFKLRRLKNTCKW